MQFDSNVAIFDTVDLSIEHPFSPEGSLFTYYPSASPKMFHYHNFLELGYCESGTGVFNIDGRPVPFHGRCTSVIYDGQVHIAQSINSEGSLWHFLYIDLNCLFADCEFAGVDFLKRMKFNNWKNYEFPSILPEAEYPAFYALCRDILDECAAMRGNAIQTVQGLTYSLLKKHERLFAEMPAAVRQRGSVPSLVQELGPTLNYINKNYRENITIDDLVSVAKMSKSNLQRKMIACTGKAPVQYIRHLRLKYATALLLDDTKTVAEIAELVGYNLSSFNRQFLKEYGMTPTAWRKNGTI